MTGVGPLLVFTAAVEFVHDSIPHGIELLTDEARGTGMPIEVTDDPAAFDGDLLDRASAVVFLNTSGNALDPERRERVLAYVKKGGGFAGVHCSSTAEYTWAEYERLTGARGAGHPMANKQAATVIVRDGSHPSTAFLPTRWEWVEEWYSFHPSDMGGFRVLLDVDESTYDPEGHAMGDPHPVCWAGRYGEGLTWYTSLGHHAESYSDPLFRRHVGRGVTSVARGEYPGP